MKLLLPDVHSWESDPKRQWAFPSAQPAYEEKPPAKGADCAKWHQLPTLGLSGRGTVCKIMTCPIFSSKKEGSENCLLPSIQH